MRIFLDECVNWRLSRDFSWHEVRSARQMGWTSIENGELLALVAGQFDVFVTVDRNLSYQQNLRGIGIPILVLRASTNRLADLRKLVLKVLQTVTTASPGTATLIGDPRSG
jgi:predicted nuclease of predicted toxin-antitoxin system